ncbi:MAG: hypoxanthine phosphoribosyltransferase [Cytophagales bacterium]|nr:hypoxanthine phosphoribosyltransferase [Cytophagales bacterium]
MQILDQHFEIFIPASSIQQRIKDLGVQINKDYRGKNPIFLSILNGAFIFAADLIREIHIPSEISFIKLKSYKRMESGGKIRELLGLEHDIFNRNIVIVEDIVDTGKTLNHILEEFKELGARSIEILTLLHKKEANRYPIDLRYVGFEIPDKFVVGYGLDYEGQGRNLKDIYKVISVA